MEENKLIRQDKERRLSDLEEGLIAAARGSKVELTIADIQKEGLLTALREQTRRK